VDLDVLILSAYSEILEPVPSFQIPFTYVSNLALPLSRIDP